MTRTAILALAFTALSAGAIAQQPAPSAPTTPASAASCPTTTTLDELTKAIYAAVSGPYDKDRTCFRDLFLPDARLSPIAKTPDGAFAPRNLTVEDWIAAVRKRGTGNFFEMGTLTRVETYGHLAHLWSTYESRSELNGKPIARGINSIQAAFDGTRWRVQAILWQAETPDTPLPAKYLP
jgi:hypothetical protein